MADGGPLAGFLTGFTSARDQQRQQALDNIASILQQHQVNLADQQQALAERQFTADQAYRNWQQGFEQQKFQYGKEADAATLAESRRKTDIGARSDADKLAADIQKNKDDYDANYMKMLTMGGMGVGLAGVLTRMNRERLDRGNAPLDLSHYGLPGVEVPPEGAQAPYNTYRTDALPGQTVLNTPQALAGPGPVSGAPGGAYAQAPPSAIDLPQMLMAQSQTAPPAADTSGLDQAALYASPVGVPSGVPSQGSLIPYNMPLPPRVVGATPPATVDDLISALYPNAGPDVRAALSQPLPGVSSLIEHRDVLNQVGRVNAATKAAQLPYAAQKAAEQVKAMQAGTKKKLFDLGFGEEKLKRYIAMTPLTIDQARKRLELTDRQITHSDLSSTYLGEMIKDMQANRPFKQFGYIKPLIDATTRANKDVEEGQKALDDNNDQTATLNQTITSLDAIIDQATSKGLSTVKISGQDFPIDYAEKLRQQYVDQRDQLNRDYADKALALDALKQNASGLKDMSSTILRAAGKGGTFTPVDRGGNPTGYGGLPGLGPRTPGGKGPGPQNLAPPPGSRAPVSPPPTRKPSSTPPSYPKLNMKTKKGTPFSIQRTK